MLIKKINISVTILEVMGHLTTAGKWDQVGLLFLQLAQTQLLEFYRPTRHGIGADEGRTTEMSVDFGRESPVSLERGHKIPPISQIASLCAVNVSDFTRNS